ncbi:efflux RND transporter periplasmic adaptor subunit [Pseudomonadota bacterium]
MLNFLKKKWVRYSAVVVGIIVIAFFVFGKGDKPEYVLAVVEKGDIVQTVSVTGSIKADPTIDLHFQKSGKVKEINVDEGDEVKEDQLLAILENRTLELQILRNQANVDYAQAKYNQTKAGAKYEEIQIAAAEVESARAQYNTALTEFNNIQEISDANVDLSEIAYKQAKENADAALKDLQTTTELAEKEIDKLQIGGSNVQTIALNAAYAEARTNLDIVMTSINDSMFVAEDTIGIRGSGTYLLPEVKKNQLKTSYYYDAEDDYNYAVEVYNDISGVASEEEIDDAMDASITAANSILILLTQIGAELQEVPSSSQALEDVILEISMQSSSLSGDLLTLTRLETEILNIKIGTGLDAETLILNYELQIDAAESKYNTAINNLNNATLDLKQAELNAENADNNAEANLAMKKAALDAASATLSLKKTPARSVDLATLAAQIKQAEIELEIAQNEHRDSQLVAPLDGLITFIYGKVGENISLSETALSAFLRIQVDNLMVEANVPETDITKIEVGDKVEMTVDAFDFTDKFDGTVIYVDPAETVIQGVIYYEIKAAFDLDNEELKSGMTTNLDIITDKKEDVLIIPARAVKYEDSIRYVEVLNNGTPKKEIIEVGLESDQFVEITSGLKEGDKIITFTK